MEEQIWLNAAQAVLTQIGVGAGLHYMDIWRNWRQNDPS